MFVSLFLGGVAEYALADPPSAPPDASPSAAASAGADGQPDAGCARYTLTPESIDRMIETEKRTAQALQQDWMAGDPAQVLAISPDLAGVKATIDVLDKSRAFDDCLLVRLDPGPLPAAPDQSAVMRLAATNPQAALKLAQDANRASVAYLAKRTKRDELQLYVTYQRDWSARWSSALAVERQCRAADRCMAERVCVFVRDRRDAMRQIQTERANPSGVVDMELLHELGEQVQADDAKIKNQKDIYRNVMHKAFTSPCP